MSDIISSTTTHSPALENALTAIMKQNRWGPSITITYDNEAMILGAGQFFTNRLEILEKLLQYNEIIPARPAIEKGEMSSFLRIPLERVNAFNTAKVLKKPECNVGLSGQ